MTKRNVPMDTIVVCTCAWNVIAVNTRALIESNAVTTWNVFMDGAKANQRAAQVNDLFNFLFRRVATKKSFSS